MLISPSTFATVSFSLVGVTEFWSFNGKNNPRDCSIGRLPLDLLGHISGEGTRYSSRLIESFCSVLEINVISFRLSNCRIVELR